MARQTGNIFPTFAQRRQMNADNVQAVEQIDLKLLAPLAKDGLVDVDEKGIQVTAKGRLLIRNICMCFDTYLRQKARMQQFSRVI